MSAGDEQVRTLIAEQASAWYLTHRAGTLDEPQRRAFAFWLTTSAVHVEEYLGVALLAQELPTLTDDPEMPRDLLLARARDGQNVEPIRTVPPQLLETVGQARAARRTWLLAVAAGVVAVTGALAWWNAGRGSPVQYSTRHGQQSSLPLSDGSLLRLDTDTAVTVRYSRSERYIELTQGQVLFEVAHEVGRPFRVRAGAADIVAIGTEFNVFREGAATVLTVVHGRVAIALSGNQPSVGVGAPRRLAVRAGEQIRVIRGFLPAEPTTVDPQRTTAWLHRELTFDQEPLAAVAAEFNRYGAVPIEIESKALRALPVSGVFSVDDTESFIAFLRNLEGVSVEVTPTRIRVLGSAPTITARPTVPK